MHKENPIENGIQGEGWIEVITGSMFSGKTEELLRRIKRAEIARQQIRLFKPEIDRRYSETEIVSHNKNSYSTTLVKSPGEILEHSAGFDVIGIDEAQFFDDTLPDICNRLANDGVRVIVAGLDMDFKGRPFGPMPHMMAIAEYVTKVHAICVKTGRLAHYSHRIIKDEGRVMTGSLESYQPLSRKAYWESFEGDADHV